MYIGAKHRLASCSTGYRNHMVAWILQYIYSSFRVVVARIETSKAAGQGLHLTFVVRNISTEINILYDTLCSYTTRMGGPTRGYFIIR